MAKPLIFKDKIVWITGASSGIGAATAYEFARTGATLILSARSEGKLHDVAEECRQLGAKKTAVLTLDLEDTASLPAKAQEAIALFGQIDVLFNNGGVSQRSLSWETPVEIDRKLMELNYFSGLILTKSVLPGMMQRNSGWIIANSSISGTFGFPLRSAYAASKHAVYGFYESLRAELAKTAVSVTVVAPGRINTPISLSAVTKDGTPHGQMDGGQKHGIPAERCARAIVKAAAKGKPEAIIGGPEILMVYLRRMLPCLFFRIVSKVNPK